MERYPAVALEVDRYLSTGEHDHLFQAWPGRGLLDRARDGDAALRQALIGEVHRHSDGRPAPWLPLDLDVVAFTRARVAPMVRGLFPRIEQGVVLDVLARSVVFLTPESIDGVLRSATWLSTAWTLANLYIESVGAEPLSAEAPNIVGLSEETTCFVSLEYFRCTERFADFLLHEAAHIFHNCKRAAIGLTETRTREWLLPIAFGKRETFAWACEAYGRILELGRRPDNREALLAELERGVMPSDDRVDADEYLEILREAVAARNGWKRILHACSEPVRPRARDLRGGF